MSRKNSRRTGLRSRWNGFYRRHRNGLRTALAVVLTLTLAAQCGLLWVRMLPEGSLSLPTRQETTTDNSAGAMPIRFAARNTEGLYGVAYHTDSLKEAYETTAAVWAQALEQAEQPSVVQMDAYSSALTQQLLMMEYDGNVPVDILAGWLGCRADSLQDCTLGTMVLCKDKNNQFRLYFRDGQRIRCAETRVDADAFDTAAQQFEPNGCRLAAEEGQTVAPDLLYDTEEAVFDVMSFSAYSGSEGMNGLLEAFGMDAAVAQQKAYETDGVMVYVSGANTIRLASDGSMEYRGTGVSVKAAQGHDRLMQYVQTAYRLTGEALEAMDSGAAPALLRAETEEETGRYVVDYGMQINSVPVDHAAGYFARYIFDNGILVQAKLYLRTCQSTGESIAVMPVRQAAASQSLDADTRLSLRYVDTAQQWGTYEDTGDDSLWNADMDAATGTDPDTVWDADTDMDTDMDTEWDADTSMDMPEDADLPWDEIQEAGPGEEMTQDMPGTAWYDNTGTAVFPQWYVIRYGNVPLKDVGRTLSPEEITVVQADFDRLIQGGDGA